jgi:hypothetical protein
VKIRWTPAAAALARRYMPDQDGMRAIGAAVAALAGDPYRRKRFTGADITGDLITIERVDRVADD